MNRGIAAYNGKIYMGMLDAHLVAIDAKTGKAAWNVDTVPESLGLGAMRKNYSITMAPRVAKGKVFVGGSGGEFGVRGWIAAYDAETGKEVWRFWTVPGDPAKPDNAVSDSALAKAAEHLAQEHRVLEAGRRRHRLGCGRLRSGHRPAVFRHRQWHAVESRDARSQRVATISMSPRSSR